MSLATSTTRRSASSTLRAATSTAYPPSWSARRTTETRTGTYLGDTEAASEAIGKRLAKNLRPLDFIDTLECTEGIQNVGHLKYNLITRQACPKTKYICSVTPPEISEGPAIDGSNRIRKSWELLTEAEDTPAKYKDLGWRQAMLPTITGGSGVDTGVTSVGVLNDTGEGRTGVLKNEDAGGFSDVYQSVITRPGATYAISFDVWATPIHNTAGNAYCTSTDSNGLLAVTSGAVQMGCGTPDGVLQFRLEHPRGKPWCAAVARIPNVEGQVERALHAHIPHAHIEDCLPLTTG